ncbi:MAG: N-formylglutamate amidohydrolase [Chloroflexi bacterium]|nr:N-formylglutamate amidohydrolase [Chloroflexota bacterium]
MSFSPEKAFTLMAGSLPIVLTLPHATPLNSSYASELEERAYGLKKTETGLLEITERFTQACHAQKGTPYVLIAQVHRSRIDFSRSKHVVAGEQAYDDSRAEPLYDAFEQSLAALSQQVMQDTPAALLFDLHGCRTREPDIYIGTLNGKTITSYGHTTSLRDRLHDLLTKRGWRVEPKPGSVETAFTGRSDSIIARHNLSKLAVRPGNFGSLQIEISQQIRLRTSYSQQFAHDFAEAALALIE